jgi:hypothetical protein
MKQRLHGFRTVPRKDWQYGRGSPARKEPMIRLMIPSSLNPQNLFGPASENKCIFPENPGGCEQPGEPDGFLARSYVWAKQCTNRQHVINSRVCPPWLFFDAWDESTLVDKVEPSKAQRAIRVYTSIPWGCLTLIAGTKKWGFSCKVQRRPPVEIFLNESLPPKTPYGHHVHGRHCHGYPVKNLQDFQIDFRKKYETLTLTSKICILQENGFKELTLVLLKSLF